MRTYCAVVTALCAANTQAFTIAPGGGRWVAAKSTSAMFSTAPDTVDVDVSDVNDNQFSKSDEESDEGPSSSAASLIDTLKAGDQSSKSQRIIVNELLYKLERTNPTEEAAASPLLNGVWELVYNGGYSDGLLSSPTRQLALFLYAGGYTPGAFGLQLARLLPSSVLEVADVEVTISREQPRSTSSAVVQVGGIGTSAEVAIAANLETSSDFRLKETYASVSLNGQVIDIPDALQYSRDLYVTYLDDDVLVVRDESGVPEILLRKSKEFTSTEGTAEPSSADDDLAPGAG